MPRFAIAALSIEPECIAMIASDVSRQPEFLIVAPPPIGVELQRGSIWLHDRYSSYTEAAFASGIAAVIRHTAIIIAEIRLSSFFAF
jgi:hypothetical protein